VWGNRKTKAAARSIFPRRARNSAGPRTRNGHYSLVVSAGPPGGSDPGQIQELLASAQGYAVFGREGKRLGAFIELAGTGAKQIAIRPDGTFLRRRRLLPITTVSGVFPGQRAVMLNVDQHSSAGGQGSSDARVERPSPAENSVDSAVDAQRRIARYLSSAERETDQANQDHADATRRPVESAASERPLPAPTPQLRSEQVDSAEPSVSGHLVFISSSRGYALVELDGPPPSLGAEVELPEQPSSLLVAKLGPSPLPNDSRICAYLEQTDGDPAFGRDS
jgi:hypothetical protein